MLPLRPPPPPLLLPPRPLLPRLSPPLLCRFISSPRVDPLTLKPVIRRLNARGRSPLRPVISKVRIMPSIFAGPPNLSQFLENFYKASDNPTDHHGYLNYFTEDATLVMGLKTFKGHGQIFEMRHAIWANVSSRVHVVSKVFPSTSAEDKHELMLFGTVDYGLKNGKELRTEWAGRMVFDEKDTEKMRFYQVYLDASPGIVAAGKRIVCDESGVGVKVEEDLKTKREELGL